ncbi:MAG: glycoside hydrolase family 1 protein [Candidatus Omnitrophica bacterium]|nr:glycoside hydrolase family 1 protein [Candidatus Omnitrophota bacterium]
MFPKKFLWGAATSAHQVEGQNKNNDWWSWEQENPSLESSGRACNHYEMFKQDFDLAVSLNHNAHRFSIEWSRIEPEEGKFDEKEIAHYQNVIDALLERKIEPIITLHHFTNPVWISNKTGWLNNDTAKYFQRYAEKVADSLGRKVKYWITINEPMVFVHASYLAGNWPPQDKSLIESYKVMKNLIIAHKLAYEKIHQVFKNKNLGQPMVSIAQHFHLFHPCPYGIKFLNRFPAYLRNKLFNIYFLDKIRKHLDFIGVNYYTRDFVSFNLLNFREMFGYDCNRIHSHQERINSLNWEIYPEGLLEILDMLRKFDLPLMITENGICTQDDSERWNFIKEHIKQIEKALNAGIPVIGYLYWSLLDNFEWKDGFAPRFGLIEVDYSNFKRIIKDSAREFAKFIKSQE